ncbi:MAG: hypothetical protein WCS43_09900 [Verrucomicrobiota bacterium]
MEHTLHAWAMVGLFAYLVRFLMGDKTRPGLIFLWALMAVGARYESLFALPPLLIWLALRGKWSTVFELAGGMALPVMGFAAYSLAHGGYALPNSLILKGNIAGAFHFHAFESLMEIPYLAVLASLLLMASLISLFSKEPNSKRLAWLPASVIVMILIHLQLAKLGWFWRYEGYLIILGILAMAPALAPSQAWLRRLPAALSLVICVLLVFCCFPLFKRGNQAHCQITQAAGNIHDQQLQMAQVVRHLGKGARVAANDIGAVSFLTDASILDLWGLGDNRIAKAKHEHSYNSEFIKARLIEEQIDYVICYPSWFMPPTELPASLIPVERWVLGNNLICGSDTVVFYATSQHAVEKLALALDHYHSESKPEKYTSIINK